MRIVLVGNPNCGKTSLFNRLTGARQKVGNWPGVTVDRKSGFIRQKKSAPVEVVDLPGLYTLDTIASGADERIAAEVLQQGDYDLIVNVVDASNLPRHLLLTTSLQSLGKPVWVALTMGDVASRNGLTIRSPELSAQLSAPVYPVVGSTGTGIDALIHDLLAADIAPASAASGCGCISSAAASGASSESESSRADAGASSATSSGEHCHQRVSRIIEHAQHSQAGKSDLTSLIDRVALNKWLGIPLFLAVMYLMFTLAINLGTVFSDFFDILVGAVAVEGTRSLLADLNAPLWLQVFLADGVGGGIQIVSTFIPVIAFLYLCLSFLEDSGYLSRAAFLVDRLMVGIGLPGQAFVPLIVGFGCNVPAVMAARTLGRQADRLLVMLMAPFMSCSARLTVYVLFAAVFFPDQGQNVVFLLYLIGILVAAFSGWLFRKHIFALVPEPSVMEMPAYHLPVWRNIFLTTWFRLKSFVLRAGKTIVVVVTLLTVLSSVTISGEIQPDDQQHSLLAEAGRLLAPVTEPLGVKSDNWAASVGLITGIFAKETVAGTLEALYSPAKAEGDAGRVATQEAIPGPAIPAAFFLAVHTLAENLTALEQNLGDPLGLGEVDVLVQERSGANAVESNSGMLSGFDGTLGAFCYLVLVLLYSPCVAVLAAVRREAGLRWMLIMAGWTTGVGYSLATLIYQIGTFVRHPTHSLIWVTGLIVAGGLATRALKQSCRPVLGSQIPLVNLN